MQHAIAMPSCHTDDKINLKISFFQLMVLPTANIQSWRNRLQDMVGSASGGLTGIPSFLGDCEMDKYQLQV